MQGKKRDIQGVGFQVILKSGQRLESFSSEKIYTFARAWDDMFQLNRGVHRKGILKIRNSAGN